MKQCYLLFILLSSATLSTGQSCYDLVWQDEFDYTGKPDPEKWGYDIGGQGWGNNELQYYTDDEKNAYVDNGVLEIKALKERVSSNNYSSARLVSKDKGDWLYGKVVVRAQLPTGRGTWPAIWMLPTDWEYGGWPTSGEIDIMEHVGYDQNKVHGTVHTDAFNHLKGTQKGGSQIVPKASTDFHEYSIEWSEDKIDFFIDGNQYYSFSNTNQGFREWPFDKRFHLIMNIAVGGSWGGAQGVDESIFPQTMKVDYVRVYQKSSAVKITGNNRVSPNSKGLVYECADIDGASYSWSLIGSGNIVSGEGTSKITLDVEDVNTRLKVVLEDNECGDSVAYLNIFVDGTTSIQKQEQRPKEPTVYSAGTTGKFIVHTEQPIEAFALYDLTGRIIPIHIQALSQGYSIQMDSNSSNGILLLEMRINGRSIFTKVLP